MLLADIGNTNFHLYKNGKVSHISFKEAKKRYSNQKLFYISVNQKINSKISKIKNWKNISSKMRLNGEYKGMGIDRKALCLYKKSGVFIDAGSAITVDIMRDGKYQGGFILLGIRAYLKAYGDISPILTTSLNRNISTNKLPKTTKDAISYGIIASIKSIISLHQDSGKLYFTGGDGKLLSTFFDDSYYDEAMVFKGILKAYKKGVIDL